jgi:hypothetical protein
VEDSTWKSALVRSLDVAGHSLAWHPPAMTVAGRGLAWPDAGGRWLPVWLPGFVSTANLRRTRGGSLKLASAPGHGAPGATDEGAPDVQPRGAPPRPARLPPEDTPTQHQRCPSPWPGRAGGGMTVPAMADRDLQARSWTAGLCGCWRCAIKCSPPRSAPRRDREPGAGRAAPA